MNRSHQRIPALRIVAVLVLCVALAPAWELVVLFQSSLTGDAFLALGPFVAGSVLAGGVFLAVARIRGTAPSLAFAMVLPGIGVLGFAIAQWPPIEAVAFITQWGLLWAYWFVGYQTLPMAFVHTLFMRWALGMPAWRVGSRNIAESIEPQPDGSI